LAKPRCCEKKLVVKVNWQLNAQEKIRKKGAKRSCGGGGQKGVGKKGVGDAKKKALPPGGTTSEAKGKKGGEQNQKVCRKTKPGDLSG